VHVQDSRLLRLARGSLGLFLYRYLLLLLLLLLLLFNALSFHSVAIVLTLVQNLNDSEDIKIGLGSTMKRISKPQLKKKK